MTDINRIPFKPRHVLDKDLQSKTKRTGYNIEWHPRRFSKPVACQRGNHGSNLETKLINGIPHLVCKKCGEGIGEGIYNNTWTKQDIHQIKRLTGKGGEPRTKEQRMKDSWDALQKLREKYTDKEIERLMAKRRRERQGLI